MQEASREDKLNIKQVLREGDEIMKQREIQGLQGTHKLVMQAKSSAMVDRSNKIIDAYLNGLVFRKSPF